MSETITSKVNFEQFGIGNDRVFRMKVPGGWLVKTETHSHSDSMAVAMCFLPDPTHVWGKEND